MVTLSATRFNIQTLQAAITFLYKINPLNAELNPICYLLALLELTIFSTLAG
jgi:hypothetical protein